MTMTVRKELTIRNALGLHARAAAQLVKTANQFPCEVAVECDGQSVNGKSIMGVLMLAAAQGMAIVLVATGDQAQACVDAIEKLVEARFGEPQ